MEASRQNVDVDLPGQQNVGDGAHPMESSDDHDDEHIAHDGQHDEHDAEEGTQKAEHKLSTGHVLAGRIHAAIVVVVVVGQQHFQWR